MKIYNIEDTYKFIKMMMGRKRNIIVTKSTYEFYDDIRSLEALDRYDNSIIIEDYEVYISKAHEGNLVYITNNNNGFTIYLTDKYIICKALIRSIIKELY